MVMDRYIFAWQTDFPYWVPNSISLLSDTWNCTHLKQGNSVLPKESFVFNIMCIDHECVLKAGHFSSQLDESKEKCIVDWL